jgi:indolepyruvate ferredoxin oxidoreductase
VLTVGAILAMAAHLEGKATKILDQTGMAQKGGAVTSHIRIGPDTAAIPSARLGAGQADVLIACDLVVASGPEVLALARPDTQVLANADVVPTGEFQRNRNLDLTASRFLTAIGKRVDPANVASLSAGSLASRLLGDTIFTNLMMLGFAAQKGLLPVALASIEEAVRLNGVAVRANLAAFAVGRLAAAGEEFLPVAPQWGGGPPRSGVGGGEDPSVDPAGRHLPMASPQGGSGYAAVVAHRSRLLADYQNDAYAAQYRGFLDTIETTLQARGITNREPLLTPIARGLAKLMAYKDEYEVARLYAAPAFRESLAETFAGKPKLKIHLAPPLLAFRKDARTGRPRKIAFGGWIFPVFTVLARFKVLRGTPLDAFGYTAERRMERSLVGEYRALVEEIAAKVTPRTMATAIDLAAAADLVSGYGPVKDAGVVAYRARVADLRGGLSAAPTTPSERVPEPA